MPVCQHSLHFTFYSMLYNDHVSRSAEVLAENIGQIADFPICTDTIVAF
jgi:hypothetical protein